YDPAGGSCCPNTAVTVTKNLPGLVAAGDAGNFVELEAVAGKACQPEVSGADQKRAILFFTETGNAIDLAGQREELRLAGPPSPQSFTDSQPKGSVPVLV